MRNNNRLYVILFMLLLAVPGQALANFTVTIVNETKESVSVYPKQHDCLHNPNYFEKTLAAYATIQVHAKWEHECGAQDVEVCRRDSHNCVWIDIEMKNYRTIKLKNDGKIKLEK